MFALPALPFAYDALEPTMSAQTLRFHHDKHHAAYIKALNDILQTSGGAPSSLEEVIVQSAKGGQAKLFNNAAQAWNHAFFWASMAPSAAKPDGGFAQALDAEFSSLDLLREAFVAEGVGHFGSGWVWLVAASAGKISIRSTHDAHDMVSEPDVTPLLVCDVWEHAYYLDFQNDRKAFLTAWFDKLANWPFADAQWQAARQTGTAWRFPAPETTSAAA